MSNKQSMKARQRTGFGSFVGFCTLCLIGGSVLPVHGQDLTGLLPTAAQSKEWTPKGAPKRLTGEQIYDYMDGAGEIPLACGYQTLAAAEYAGKSGAVLTIELYDMGNNANAFGLYSMKRLPTGRVVTTLGSHTAPVQAQAGYNELLFHKGRYTVLLFGDASGKVKDADLLALGTTLAARIKETGSPLPDLLRSLPPEGYVPRTAKYFHGKAAMDTIKFVREDVFQLKAKPEVVVATYANPPGKLMVIRYGSETEAMQVRLASQKASETKGMIFVQQGRLLGAAWGAKSKPTDPASRPVDPALINHLKRTLQKPGLSLETVQPGR